MEPTTVGEILTRKEFLRRLEESKLLARTDLERAAALNVDDDALALAHSLVSAGLLTEFQVEALSQSRFSELQIGNYEILDKLGAGGMGTVFKARHRRMKRVVALKVLARNLCKDQSFVQRFQREVETIARLSHPNIVMAYDADEGDLGHFLVMEFVNGQDLASLVQKQGSFRVADAVDCILQAARGLEYAHAQNIIHRDIKPANLLRDTSGVVKVTDLGLARLNDKQVGAAPAAANALTQAGGMLGTVDYMPPEQAIDATSIDDRADIYSLGATLYYLLMAMGPYTASTMMAILLKHREAPIPSLSSSRPDVPERLDALFRRMMAKAPTDRYRTMTDVVKELEAIQQSLSAVSAPAQSVKPSAAVQGTQPTSQGTRPENTVITGPDAMLPTVVAGKVMEPVPCGQIKVLLVEPSRTQAGIIRKFLQSNQVETILTASTGKEALAVFHANRPDVVLSAMHLNDMTGIQLARLLREDGRGCEFGFVLVSSEAESREADTLSKSGLSVLLHKPFSSDQLMDALRVALRRSDGSKPLSSPRSGRDRLKVLLVDDSTPARLHVRKVLHDLGFTQFVEAADGAQAVALTTTEKFDLIVTDYNMPHMEGRGLVGYLKQNPATAAVPIIMVTTETDPAKLDAVRRMGVAICAKNFPREVVEQILDGMF
jgi:serine/threonine protein kinase